MKYYNAQTNGFYDPEINTTIPDNSVEITDELWQELLAGQSEGKIITSDSEGYPILIDPPAPDWTVVNKSTASSLLTATDWTAIGSVADPAVSDPYLTNQAEFLAWRSEIRAIAVAPPATEWTPPATPAAAWSMTIPEIPAETPAVPDVIPTVPDETPAVPDVIPPIPEM